MLLGEYGEFIFIVLNQITLKLDKFMNLRTQVATLKWQLQLTIMIQLSVGCLLVDYVDGTFYSIESNNDQV